MAQPEVIAADLNVVVGMRDLGIGGECEHRERRGRGQDEVGEPVAMSGVPLYNKNVVRGHEPPQPAAQQLGGGRLQRLWLARGGAGGGKMTGNAERRLRRLAALKVNDGAAEQPMLEGESANESRL